MKKFCRRSAMEALEALGFPTSILEKCSKVSDISTCRVLHSILVQVNLEITGFWIDHLIRCYALCGSLIDSVNTFHRVAQPTVYTWNSVISAHVYHGESRFASELYQQMLHQKSCKPDKFTYLVVLKTTYSLVTLMIIHDNVIRFGLHLDIAVCNSLMHLYCKYGSLDDAVNLFEALTDRNVISWTAMLSGYVLHGYGLSALEMYCDMKGQGIKPNRATFLSALKACGDLECAEEGRLIHDEIVRCGLDLDITVGNTLVDMFAKCNSLEEARSIFVRIEDETAVSWGAMIFGYSLNGQGFQALKLFEAMQTKKTKPSRNTLSCIYKACLKGCSLEVSIGLGRLIHDLLVKANLESDIDTGSAVIDMYWKCGSLSEAYVVFTKLPSQDAVSMGAMIAGYAEHGEGLLALNLCEIMLLNDMKPNTIIYSSILKACGSSALVLQGRYFHDEIIKQKLEMDVIIGNTLIDMYVKFGTMDDAQNVFEQLQIKDDISWGTIILGSAEHELNELALELLERLREHDIKLGKVTVLSVIKACSITRLIKHGRWIHNKVIINSQEKDTIIKNGLVDMYIKCGSLDEANKIFLQLSNPNLLLWGSMVAGCAIDGNWQLAREYFESLQCQGLIPDDIIFTGILAACSHSGLLREGMEYFRCMIEDIRITPSDEHFNCIVNLLGRAGQLIDAECFLRTLPREAGVILWRSLLTSCRTYCDIPMGRICLREITCLEPSDASAYLLMSDIYADAQLWTGVNEMEELRKQTVAARVPGLACLQIGNHVYQFVAATEVHCEENDIFIKLKRIYRLMKLDSCPYLDLVQSNLYEGQGLNIQKLSCGESCYESLKTVIPVDICDP